MPSIRWWAAAGWFLASLAAIPSWSQVDGTGARTEFRSPDRRIPAVGLSSGIMGSSDRSDVLTTAPPTASDVLKRIDKELGGTGTSSAVERDAGPSEAPPSRADNKGGLGDTRLK